MKYILLMFMIVMNCNSQNNHQNKIITNKYELAHTLKIDSLNSASVFVRYFKDGLFDTLYIVKKVSGKSDTLYSIERDLFKNKKGKDLAVYPKNFYGYSFVLRKDKYIVLSYLRNKGENISDNITIQWNELSNRFQVLKTP